MGTSNWEKAGVIFAAATLIVTIVFQLGILKLTLTQTPPPTISPTISPILIPMLTPIPAPTLTPIPAPTLIDIILDVFFRFIRQLQILMVVYLIFVFAKALLWKRG